MNKRIKIIRSATVPTSLYTFCKGILKELSEKYEVVALSSPGEEIPVIAECEGVRTITVPMERYISIKKDIISLWKLIKVFRSEKPTIVHSMTPKAGLLCMMAAYLTRVPIRIHTFTGLVFPTSTGLKRKILMLTDSITCACATHIIPEGEGVKNDLVNNGITKKPMRVLGYGNVRGVDMEHFSRRPEVMKLSESIRNDSLLTFLFVGRIVRDKGINELCQAMDRLSGFAPARLIFVGYYEETLDPISDESRDIIDKNPSIEYVGPKLGDELLAYYAAADCFVFPSYREGFPNTVLEAGAMGLPSIVTDINGSREIIRQDENGVIIPSKNVNALFDAMLNMVRDKVARERMAGNARRMVAERFEQGFVKKCLYDFYDELLFSRNRKCVIL
jgi:glycosyltransferase involved in cell wall biosynthesis